jgi:GMP synthase (glutamine-hydrolysing)
MTDIHADKILILDFGSQYTQLIARRLREIGVYCELLPYDVDESFVREFNPRGVILSGGPETVTAAETPRISAFLFELGVPLLGICYGMQAMAQQLGGEVQGSDHCEFGHALVEVLEPTALFKDIEDEISPNSHAMLNVWMSHGDKVTAIPDGFKVIAQTESAPIAAMADESRQFYALQFHPEVTHTAQGERMLRHFVVDICGCATLWTAANIIESSVEAIRQQVGEDRVLVALSGGVDSAVTAALIHKAIGDRLTCMFVDTGLLRHNEGDQVMQLFHDHLGMDVIRVNAAEDFLGPLQGEPDPETKRKICGEAFIRVFERESKALANIKWLGQGTIYPDVIESAAVKGGKAHVIKSHHNVGGLPEDMQFQLVEPLRELFKDEVRRVGLELGLPRSMLFRHPFPGPGLAVRILGEVKHEYVPILQAADHIFMEELRAHDLYDEVSQAFAVFLPVRSVGVKGDARCYEYVIALRAVKTIDFMTATYADLPHAFLGHVARRIMNEIKQVARVTYDISSKPPATIEWE